MITQPDLDRLSQSEIEEIIRSTPYIKHYFLQNHEDPIKELFRLSREYDSHIRFIHVASPVGEHNGVIMIRVANQFLGPYCTHEDLEKSILKFKRDHKIDLIIS